MNDKDLKIVYLTNDRISDFINYCNQYKSELDESFLNKEELTSFKPDQDNPTYILIDYKNKIVGAISLIMDEYFRKGKRARFRIFHTIFDCKELYQRLFASILKDTNDTMINKLFVFVLMNNLLLKKQIEALNFTVDRYSYYLVRENQEVLDYTLPPDYRIADFEVGKDEDTWCSIRNTCFRTLKGSETPITKDMVTNMVESDDYLEGGMMILYHQNSPIGIVRGSLDDIDGEPTLYIGPLAILPKYQSQGLGRLLLRAMLDYAKKASFTKTSLSVNAENERAKSLYLQEGFKEFEAVVCYRYDLKK